MFKKAPCTVNYVTNSVVLRSPGPESFWWRLEGTDSTDQVLAFIYIQMMLVIISSGKVASLVETIETRFRAVSHQKGELAHCAADFRLSECLYRLGQLHNRRTAAAAPGRWQGRRQYTGWASSITGERQRRRQDGGRGGARTVTGAAPGRWQGRRQDGGRGGARTVASAVPGRHIR